WPAGAGHAVRQRRRPRGERRRHVREFEHRRYRQRLHADRRVRGGRSRGREPVLQHHGAVMRSSELDARRELAREFRIEGLLQRPPGPIVYLARDAEERPLALKVAPRVDGGPEDRFHAAADAAAQLRSEEHTSELQALAYLACRLLLETKHAPELVP